MDHRYHWRGLQDLKGNGFAVYMCLNHAHNCAEPERKFFFKYSIKVHK